MAGRAGCARASQWLRSVGRWQVPVEEERPRAGLEDVGALLRAAAAGRPEPGMASWWRALPRAARRYPWPTNVLLYTALYSAGDALQQRLRGCPADWRQTQHVATVAVTFHANFNYVWLRLLERALPGRAPRAVLAKVLCDQVLAAPVAVSAFYSGEGRAGEGALRPWLGRLE